MDEWALMGALPKSPAEQDFTVPTKGEVAANRGVKAQPERLFPDPRRELAQKAAKAQWADWASKKAQ